MGMFRKSCSTYVPCNKEAPPPPAPDPTRFKLSEYLIFGQYLLVRVVYPNCTNFEGHKIMLYKGVSIEELTQAKILDPHFQNIKFAPIARFTPTKEGWLLARQLCTLLLVNETVEEKFK
jgi:hypothetical protein